MVSLDRLHTIAENGLKDQLQQLGFDVTGNVGFDLLLPARFLTMLTHWCQAMNVLFPHHVGHYIGLDVHDCPGYLRNYALKAGQCITVEP